MFDVDVDLSLIGSKEMIWKTSFLLIVSFVRQYNIYLYSTANISTCVNPKSKLGSVVTHNRVFHNHTKLAMLALLPTLYLHTFAAFFFFCSK